MNDVDILLEQLQEHPDDDVLAFAVRDALVESDQFSPHRAEWRVWAERELAAKARDLAQATHLMRGEGDSGIFLRWHIRRFLGRQMPESALMLVVAGDDEPRLLYTPARGPRRPLHTFTVTVGAGWIMDVWADRQAELQRRADRPRPSRR